MLRRPGIWRTTFAHGVRRRNISHDTPLIRTEPRTTPPKSKRSLWSDIWFGAKVAFATVTTGHVFIDYFYAAHGTWGPSMIPTINASGDWVLISKYYRHGRGLKVGDLVSYIHPLRNETFVIKRVIGMPGDFVLRDTPLAGEGHMIQVPDGHCWVVGDNMNASRDSRLYGPVPLGLVKGKIVAVCSGWKFWEMRRLPDALEDFQE